jgi:hypothetical protein
MSHAAATLEPEAGAQSARKLAVSVVIPAKDEKESLPLIRGARRRGVTRPRT